MLKTPVKGESRNAADNDGQKNILRQVTSDVSTSLYQTSDSECDMKKVENFSFFRSLRRKFGLSAFLVSTSKCDLSPAFR